MSIHFGTDFVYSLSQLLKLSSCYTILKIDILGVSRGDTNIEGHDNLIDTFLGNLQAFKMQFFLWRKLFSLKHVTVSKQYDISIMQLRIFVSILCIKISNSNMFFVFNAANAISSYDRKLPSSQFCRHDVHSDHSVT